MDESVIRARVAIAVILAVLVVGIGQFVSYAIRIGGLPNGSVTAIFWYPVSWGISALPLLLILGIIQGLLARRGLLVSLLALATLAALYWYAFIKYIYIENAEFLMADFHHAGLISCLLTACLIPILYYRINRSLDA